LAAYALGRIGDKRAIEPLMKLVNNRGLDEGERSKAGGALSRFKDPQVKIFLQQVMNDQTESKLLRLLAARALGYD
jgi:HEAT repeat protein